MVALVPEITRRSYSVELPTDMFSAITKVEDLFINMKTLGDKLDALAGTHSTEYNGHFGSAIYFDVDADEGNPYLATGVIKQHAELCLAALGLLPDYRQQQRDFNQGKISDEPVDPRTVNPIFAGPGFLFCDRGDLGVALHFKTVGGTGTKWFSDGAAEQWLERIQAAEHDRGHLGRRELIAKQVRGLISPEPHSEAAWVNWTDAPNRRAVDTMTVGFEVDDLDTLHEWLERTNDGIETGRVPAGWVFSEIDDSDVRPRVMFTVEGDYSPEDAAALRDLIDEAMEASPGVSPA